MAIEAKSSTRDLTHSVVGYLIVIGVIVLAVFLILFFQNLGKDKGNAGKHAELIQKDILYRVIEVLDGDTFVANVNGNPVTVRLIGIDTPEVVDPRKPVQCYGVEASAKAKELLSGKDVYIEKEASKGNYDKYGRVLAYARFSDNTSYNEYMIKNGYAREYTFNKEKYKYQEEFNDAEAIAKKGKLGLWGVCGAK